MAFEVSYRKQVDSFRPLKASSFTKKQQPSYLIRCNSEKKSKHNPRPTAHGFSLAPPISKHLVQFNNNGQALVLIMWQKAIKTASKELKHKITYDPVGRAIFRNKNFLFAILSSKVPLTMAEINCFGGASSFKLCQNKMIQLRKMGIVNFSDNGWLTTNITYNRLKPIFDKACILFESYISDFYGIDDMI
jgi:hypothetical protein